MVYMILKHLRHPTPRGCNSQISKVGIYHNKDIGCAIPEESVPDSCAVNVSAGQSGKLVAFHDYHLTANFWSVSTFQTKTQKIY